jgi:hypothetical protein
MYLQLWLTSRVVVRNSQTGWNRMVMLLLFVAVCIALVFEIYRALNPTIFSRPPSVLSEKVRSRTRTPIPPREPRPVTPERFEEQVSVGLNGREVQWIIEDFFDAGLVDSVIGGPPSIYWTRRAAQHRWLLDTLTEVFGLNHDQRNHAALTLAGLLEQAEVKLAKIVAGGEPAVIDGVEYRTVIVSELDEIVNPDQWLGSAEYDPWNLCPLDPGQMKVAALDNVGDAPGTWWKAFARHRYRNLRNPPNVEVSEEIRESDSEAHRSIVNILEVVHELHPAQLRTLLLLDSEVADLLITRAFELEAGE